MKRTFTGLVILLVMTMSSVIFPKQTSAQQSDVDFQVFYDELSPYGEWVDYKNYGYAWIPDAGSGFVPYSTDGHWVLSDYGWTWVSDYEWGWAPFHYGRWDYDNYYGWLWIPDNQWGPAWVNWRQADGYYGWSPMEPGISLSISFGRAYNSSNDHWMFVRDRDFERPEINRYFVNRTDHDRIVRNSRVIRTTYVDHNRHATYVTGPARADVQRYTGRQINRVSIRENSRPGQQRMNNGQLEMYRPLVNKNDSRERKAAPKSVTNLRDVKRPSERSGSKQQWNATPANNARQQKQQPQQKQQQQRSATPANNSGRQQQLQQQKAQQQKAAQQQQQRQQQGAQQQQQRRQQGAQQQQQQRQQQGAQQQQQRQQQQAQQQRQQQGAQQQQQRQQQAAQQQQQRQQAAQQRTAAPANNARQQQRQQPAQQQRTATPANGGGRQQKQKESKSENDKKQKD